MSDHLEAALIVVNYNKLAYTRLCLESVLASLPTFCHIIAIDNGSTDGTRQWLEEDLKLLAQDRGVRATVIGNDSNVGACTARNQGLAVAGERYIAFMDNDVCVRTRRWLAILTDALQAGPDIGIVGPKLLFPFEPFLIEHAGVGISRTGRVKYLGRGQPRDAPEYNNPRPVQALISACWLMKREVPDQIGGLDEIFNPAQYEDLDFCYRARCHGWQVLYEPRAELYHFESVTTDGSPDVNYRYITIRNGLEFKRRWQHVFSQEEGPADEDCRWLPLETRPIEMTGQPPMVD
ncbi:MAG: glycosyltransferase family 2 protein [Armatimonadetes bacterium]|nr:glycosyltransferase family 2 protein [Armatimonadota bacterium]